jgi:hypothetical protein
MNKRTITWRHILSAAVLLGLALACQLPGGETAPPAPEHEAESTVEVIAEAQAPTAESGAEPAEATLETSEPEPAPEPLELHPLLSLAGILEMENLMPTEGVGVRPRLAWQAVDGAALYAIVIFEADGTPYWAWRHAETGVFVGGIDEALPETNEGPRIGAGMSWQVVAYDADLTPIAAGGIWPIAP